MQDPELTVKVKTFICNVMFYQTAWYICTVVSYQTAWSIKIRLEHECKLWFFFLYENTKNAIKAKMINVDKRYTIEHIIALNCLITLYSYICPKIHFPCTCMDTLKSAYYLDSVDNRFIGFRTALEKGCF